MDKCCKICKLSNDNNTGALLFQSPQEEKRRKAWSKACGVFLSKNCLVCQNHFEPSDMIGRKKGIRLKVSALPTLHLSQEKCTTEENAEDIPFPPVIKTEPPELVLVNTPESKEQNHEFDTFLNVNVKVELNEAPEPLALIHEANFDEENSSTEVSSQGKQKTPIVVEEPVKTICGQVELTNEKGHDTFKLKCNYCEIEYQMSYWPYFIDHIKATHKKTKPDKEVVADLKDTLACESENEQKDSLALEPEDDQEDSITCEPEGNEENSLAGENEVDQEDSLACKPEDDQSDSSSNDNETDEDKKNTDQDYEPKNKKPKKEKKGLKRQNTESSRGAKENLVFFDHPDEQCVMEYLELLKSNPILWHRRQSIMKRFDEAITKITAEFNAKWPKYQMTYEQSRTSINRIKDLYQRVSDETHKRHIKNSIYLKKYPKYFELCAQIEENSKTVINPCDNCRAFFFNEIDLQVHRYKEHRIGELPFKCSRCKYGFSKAEKLAEHEQKHHRSKKFTCEVCNKGFFDEAKLLTHVAIHTNDYKPVCEVCGEMFTTLSKYRRHRLHHESPKEKCEICGKLYYEKWNLSEHVKSHLNERQYQCDICGKSFNHQNDVTIHKRGVHNVKPQKRKYVWVNKNPFPCDDNEHGFLN